MELFAMETQMWNRHSMRFYSFSGNYYKGWPIQSHQIFFFSHSLEIFVYDFGSRTIFYYLWKSTTFPSSFNLRANCLTLSPVLLPPPFFPSFSSLPSFLVVTTSSNILSYRVVLECQPSRWFVSPSWDLFHLNFKMIFDFKLGENWVFITKLGMKI